MTASATLYLQKKIVDHVLGIASYTMPTPYLALFTASPGEAGSLANEVSGGSYARQAISASMGATDLSTGISSNTLDVAFPVPTAAWGTVTHLGVADALTAGNLLLYDLVAVATIVNSGDAAPTFPAGSLIVQAE